MHVRVRTTGEPDVIVVVESKLTKIEQFRRIIKDKIGIAVNRQRLFYGGKLLEDGYTFHDYNIKLNDVIQLMPKLQTSDKHLTSNTSKSEETTQNQTDVQYKDGTSAFYAVGDLIDVKDGEEGTWFEGKVVRIVCDPNHQPANESRNDCSESKSNSYTESDSENKPPLNNSNLDTSNESPSKTKLKGIAKYFSKATNVKKKSEKEPSKSTEPKNSEEHVLYQVKLDGAEEDPPRTCELKEIRPRAWRVIPVAELQPGDTVMVNHNTDHPMEKGYWYDFTVNEVKKLRTSYELVGTLYLGLESVPQHDTTIRVHDKIFAIESVVPLHQRTEQYTEERAANTHKRSAPLNCLKCRDNDSEPCKWCGCFLCRGKENPEKIVLCDECNKGHHMACLDPPLAALPAGDWYCPACKRDPNAVVAPGAGKQARKATKAARDWGRGMACVGKTKTCAMPANHFGPIPGIEVGMRWRFRIQVSESGVHRPPVAGIHGRDVEGAYSLVLSGGYEDDVDNGIEFTYTGSGGRDLSGNKRTAGQSCDQTLSRENKALARNCAVASIRSEGASAGAAWRGGRPVRVVRSCKLRRHAPQYAPHEGLRYDGIYKVVKYYPETGKSGYRVWKYLLRRDDPAPAPWEPHATQYPVVYPDGYLEAEAERREGGKKRSLRANKDEECDASPPSKKLKQDPRTPDTKQRGRPKREPILKIVDMLKQANKCESEKADSCVSADVIAAIHADTLNERLWAECLHVARTKGQKELVEHVLAVFVCIICQELPVRPVTTPCLHNFCMTCLRLALKSTSRHCPCCRATLAKCEPTPNESLRAALQAVLPGYDHK